MKRLIALLGALLAPLAFAAAPPPKPNIVLIVCDNLGNGDLGCFGSTLHRTPHVDRLATEGTRFTSFYVASGVCTPSRAAFMTGCYPRRLNLHQSETGGAVLQPLATRGLHPDETTMAEVLRSAGYATACIGKWHLGDHPEFLPTRQGFDLFFGIPYSDDMTRDKRPDTWPDLPLMRGEQIIEAPVDRDHLVRRCTEEAVRFIEQNAARPFFLYVPHTMPGSTAHPFSSPAFRGKSRNGDYGDSVEELDWSTGEILATLRRLNLDARTLVIWTSDNGAVQRNPPQGSNAPYRGWGYDTSEGAMRMPCVMRWPGMIPAGRVQDELCTSLDLLPTLARLAAAPLPSQPIDGHDIHSLLTGEADAPSPWDDVGFCFYRLGQLQAVRAGPWKLYLELPGKLINNARKTAPVRQQLFDVRTDLHEDREVSAQHPAVVQRLLTMAARARAELGDGDQPGRGQRPAGSVVRAAPSPRLIADLNLELIWIKPGTFTMGSPPDERDRNKAEGPQRRVTLTQGFWLGKTEVTQAQYEAITGTNPSNFTEAGKNAPVERVSWLDAMAFCEKLTARERAAQRLPEGYAYTLPTEAQWEYACRADTTGDYAGNADAMAWHADNSAGSTHPVARKQPNDWGLYDMTGNVLEWCLDWYGNYSPGAQTDPTGPATGSFRTARGGSWRMAMHVGRSAARGGGSPGRRDYTLGFRLALSAVQ